MDESRLEYRGSTVTRRQTVQSVVALAGRLGPILIGVAVIKFHGFAWGLAATLAAALAVGFISAALEERLASNA